MSILEREKQNRPTNEGMIRGIKMTNKDEIIKRIQNMDHITFWMYNHYVSDYKDGKIISYYSQTIPEDKTVYFSDIEKIDNPDLSDLENIYLMHDFCGMSDYSGSLVEKSNTEVLTDEYGFITVIGGYGSLSCMIGVKSLIEMEEEESERILDILEDLNRYPLVDDDELYEQEMEAIEEAWENWTEYDFKREIGNKFDLDISDYELKSDLSLRELFDTLSDKASEYWINESGSDMWINVEKVVSVMTEEDFNTYFEVSE